MSWFILYPLPFWLLWLTFISFSLNSYYVAVELRCSTVGNASVLHFFLIYGFQSIMICIHRFSLTSLLNWCSLYKPSPAKAHTHRGRVWGITCPLSPGTSFSSRVFDGNAGTTGLAAALLDGPQLPPGPPQRPPLTRPTSYSTGEQHHLREKARSKSCLFTSITLAFVVVLS